MIFCKTLTTSPTHLCRSLTICVSFLGVLFLDTWDGIQHALKLVYRIPNTK